MSKKKKKRLRARRMRRIAIIAAAALAVLGLVVWIVSSRAPEPPQQRYPVAYESTIRLCARLNDIPPAYVASVILAESNYDPEAVSSANAQGLMQLLPETGEWIAGKLGEEYAEGCLFDPETNLRYGCWYLSFLMRRYGRDMRCASSAYHAGQGNVDKWLQNPAYSDDGLTLATIPYDSTNTYVQRILKYYEKYSKLYADA